MFRMTNFDQTARRNRPTLRLAVLVVTTLLLLPCAFACTNLLITPGASVDGSAMIAYNADSPTLMGVLYHYPPLPQTNNETLVRQIYDWDSGRYLGEIDLRQVDGLVAETTKTLNVVGNANEVGLVIAETTFGGVPVLATGQTHGKVDYGSLLYITLQYAKTCRQAIGIMSQLLDAFGYASSGESFSIADVSGDVWIMEVISRGNDYPSGGDANSNTTTTNKLGAVWVAVKIPDGSVAAHANHARITTFPRDDPDHCLYSEDVVDVAISYGLFDKDADPWTFSFSDIYDPRHFLNVRQGEARVWALFSPIADDTGDFQSKHLAYASGQDLTERMPLYLTPYRKLSFLDAISLMSSHYEDTPLDSSKDVGSGLFAAPYRPRPLVWTYDNQTYHNERSIATSKTGWNFIANVRPWLPAPLATILWFACDDSSTSPRVPVYAASQSLSPAYAGKGPQDGVVQALMTLDLSKAFWVQNMVSNLVYSRWSDAYPVLKERIVQVTKEFQEQVAVADQNALTALDTDEGMDAAIASMTDFSVKAGNAMHELWFQFYGELFVRFRDFYTIVEDADDALCNCVAQEPGMSNAVRRRIVEETGDHYQVLENGMGELVDLKSYKSTS